MPRSKMSAASSGGVSSSTLRMAPTISRRGSWIASTISLEETSRLRGRPDTRSRPRASPFNGSLIVTAAPAAILSSSAVRSPTSRLCLRLR